MKRLLLAVALFAAAALAGCATPENYWVNNARAYEDEDIFVHYVPAAGIGAYCRDGQSLGCAKRYDGACNIYIREDLSGNACVLSHERKHCKGWSHPAYRTYQQLVC